MYVLLMCSMLCKSAVIFCRTKKDKHQSFSELKLSDNNLTVCNNVSRQRLLSGSEMLNVYIFLVAKHVWERDLNGRKFASFLWTMSLEKITTDWLKCLLFAGQFQHSSHSPSFKLFCIKLMDGIVPQGSLDHSYQSQTPVIISLPGEPNESKTT